jgi:hypothetical protein
MVRLYAGEAWRGGHPELSGDANFYLSRMTVVADGELFGSNPYFIEHKNDPFPTTPVPDILAGLPLFVGLTVDTAVYVNIFLWTFVYIFLLYLLLRTWGVNERGALMGTVILLVGTYGFMLRQTSLQVFLPFYVLFLLFFSYWLHATSRRLALTLGVLIGSTPYFYPYLVELIGGTWGLTFFYLLWRSRDHLRPYLWISLIAFAVALPYVGMTLHEMANPLYAETVARYGTVFSRWPQIEAYYYGRWAIVGCVLFLLLRRNPHGAQPSVVADVMILSFGGAIAALLSTVLTGIDVENGAHVGRFIMFLLLLSTVILLFDGRSFFSLRHGRIRLILSVILAAVVLLEVVVSIPRLIGLPHISETIVTDAQNHVGLVHWLATQEAPSVVLAPLQLSDVITAKTEHLVLYSRYAKYYYASNQELEERYLVSKIIAPDGVSTMRSEYTDYWGGGRLYDAQNAHMWSALCSRISTFPRCPRVSTEFTDEDLVRFADMERHFMSEIIREPEKYLRNFHVRFLVIPKDAIIPAPTIRSWPVVFSDHTYDVYEVPV